MNKNNIIASVIYLIYCFIVMLVLPINEMMQSILILIGALGLSLLQYLITYLNKKKK